MASQPSLPQLSEHELARSKKPAVLTDAIIFTALPFTAVTLRIVARRLAHQKIWFDDAFTIVAGCLCFVQLAFLIEAMKYGLGKHVQAVNPTDVKPYLMYTYLSEIYYALAVTCVKLSILCLYLRLFQINRTLKKVCYGMMVLAVAWGIAVLFTTIFQCQPVDAAWDKTILTAKCFNLQNFVIGSNVPNIVIDAAIIALPIPVLWHLKVSATRRIGIIALFLVAAITTVVSIVRCVLNARIGILDVTWDFVNVAILSTVEVGVGVCCACMPVIYPLFRVFVGRRIFTSANMSNDQRKAYPGLSSNGRHKIASIDKGSDVDRLWSTDSGRCESPGGSAVVPMERFPVNSDGFSGTRM